MRDLTRPIASREDDWLGLGAWVKDELAKQYAATKFGVTEQEIELLRDDGCVKVRVKSSAG